MALRWQEALALILPDAWQDPLWYPRRGRFNPSADKLAYMAWRVTQGDIKTGVSSHWRRIRRIYDESNPSDMIEYHVVRDGVDELAIMRLGERFFSQLAVIEC